MAEGDPWGYVPGVLNEGVPMPYSGGGPANLSFEGEGPRAPGNPFYYGGGVGGGQAVILVFAGPPPPPPPSSKGIDNLGTGLAHDPSVNNIPPFPSVAPKSSVNQAVPILALNPMQPNHLLIGPSSHGGGPATFQKYLEALGQGLPALTSKYLMDLETEQAWASSPEWGAEVTIVPNGEMSPMEVPDVEVGDSQLEIPAPRTGDNMITQQQFTGYWDFY